MTRCFACDRPVRQSPCEAVTIDGQTVRLGLDCFARVKASRETGYQPPGGGPRLYLASFRLVAVYDRLNVS